jgi:hypothetical protein
MFKRNKKNHEFDSYLYGLVIAKSTSLLTYISTHKSGSDYARKKIIEAKYDVSHIHPVLHGMYKRAIHDPTYFDTDSESFLTMNESISRRYSIKNHINKDSFSHDIKTDDVVIDKKYKLTSDEKNAKIFLGVWKAINIIKENMDEIDFNIKSRETIDLYSQKYTQDYP